VAGSAAAGATNGTGAGNRGRLFVEDKAFRSAESSFGAGSSTLDELPDDAPFTARRTATAPVTAIAPANTISSHRKGILPSLMISVARRPDRSADRRTIPVEDPDIGEFPA
jgi:hypothetical protein